MTNSNETDPTGSRAATGRASSMELLIANVRDYSIFMLDSAGKVVSWNPGAERITGYRPDEIIGRHFSAFYPPEAAAGGICERELASAEREGSVELEGWRVRRDGTQFWASVVITAIRDDAGSLVGFAKVTRDLTERRQADLELRKSEERSRLMIESVRDYAIFMLDVDGRVATWNAGAQRIKGWTAEEIIGQHFSRFYPRDEVQAGKCEHELVTAASEGRFEDNGWRIRKDGSAFWANVVITALRDDKGRLIGFVKVTRDLTEHRKAEEERLQLARAREALRLRDEFLSIASHELRTPLAALQLQVDSLRAQPNLDERHRVKLERAARNCQLLSNLIGTLLDVSRVASRQISLQPTRFDLSALVRTVVDDYSDSAAQAGCALAVDAPHEIVGEWDRIRVEQALLNVLANAVKYGPGAPVTVTLARVEDEAVIEVRDGGPGVAEADFERIFERFERASSPRHHGGLGLGLFITREILHAHGGSVSVRNLPGTGACFTLRLPVPAANGAGSGRR